MNHSRVEILVGFFLLIGFCAFGWLALQLGEVPWLWDAKTYPLNAEFTNISGIKVGGDVQIAGVSVGRVRDITLSEDYQALIGMQINRDVVLPRDSMASIRSQGIIGDKLIQITLGGDTETYQPGETIVDTESSVDLESLISKFAFGQVQK